MERWTLDSNLSRIEVFDLTSVQQRCIPYKLETGSEMNAKIFFLAAISTYEIWYLVDFSSFIYVPSFRRYKPK